MIYRLFLVLFIASFVMTTESYAQSCPENIGFENGNFQNWKLFTGVLSMENNQTSFTLNEVAKPATGRHTIISKKNLVDAYGGFSLIPPSGGNFVAKIGDNGTGSQVDGISYLMTVPADRPDFTLTYQYAVVLEDPDHEPYEQPRFIARVKDVEKDEYIPCVSFEYVATSSLPGFKKAEGYESVIYKDWSPVTINLSGYQGKQLLIEFISTDCARGGHFGYAYVDINNVCGGPIAGSTYCKSADALNISGPSGFQDYYWYNADRSVKYGTGQSISIKPKPADGSKIVLDLVPYAGFGCPSTISTVIKGVDYDLKVLNKDVVCQNSEIDLLSEKYILNKSADFTYLAYEDKDLTKQIGSLVKITGNKTFYIKATNNKGCESIVPIDIAVYEVANITVNNPAAVCYSESVDITKNELVVGEMAGITKTYYTDEAATQVLADPQHIKVSGRYFIQFSNQFGCSKIVPVEVTIQEKPILKITNPKAVCQGSQIDLTAINNFEGSDATFQYSFYEDEALTKILSNPSKIDKSGTYHVKAVSAAGCIVSGQIAVTISNPPVFTINQPATACYPDKVDLTNPALYTEANGHFTYTFFNDETLSSPLTSPKAIAKPGTYYVKATNESGCFSSAKIVVKYNEAPKLVLNAPRAVFDNEFIDLTVPEITRGSSPFVKVTYFEDQYLKHPLQNPARVNRAGVYYVAIQSANGCTSSAPITVTVLPQPKIIVPTAFTPQKETNNRLYPFLVNVKQLTSFRVYNKWGILVYESAVLANGGWDGQFKSKMQPLETFSWFAEGIDLFGGKIQSTGKTILIL